jgi:hypothetical protein
LYKSQSVLPFPGVDDFPLQIFLPGQAIAALIEYSAADKADSAWATLPLAVHPGSCQQFVTELLLYRAPEVYSLG